MTVFEIALIVLMVLAAILGFRKGIVNQLGALAGIVLGVIACRLYGDWAVGVVSSWASSDSNKVALTVLAYVILFLVVYLLCLLIAKLLRSLIHTMQLGLIDRIAGALLKMFLWFFALSFLLNIWVSVVPEHTPSGSWAQRTLDFAPAVMGSKTAAELWQTTTPA